MHATEESEESKDSRTGLPGFLKNLFLAVKFGASHFTLLRLSVFIHVVVQSLICV